MKQPIIAALALALLALRPSAPASAAGPAATPAPPASPKVAELRALDYVVQGADGTQGFRYRLERNAEYRNTGAGATVTRRIGGREERAEVSPDLLVRAADLARRHKVASWDGLDAPGWAADRPGAFQLLLWSRRGSLVRARGLRDSADPAARPAGLPAFERDFRALADAALDGPSGARPAPVRQGLTRLDFSEHGMSAIPAFSYRLALRREAGRNVFHLSREGRLGGPAERVLSDRDMAALEARLSRLNIARWDGFSGSSRALDGVSFRLALEYTDGRSVSASGSNSFPRSYRETRRELTAFLDALLAGGEGGVGTRPSGP